MTVRYPIMGRLGINMYQHATPFTVSGVIVELLLLHRENCDLSDYVVYMPDGSQLEGYAFLDRFHPSWVDIPRPE